MTEFETSDICQTHQNPREISNSKSMLWTEVKQQNSKTWEVIALTSLTIAALKIQALHLESPSNSTAQL